MIACLWLSLLGLAQAQPAFFQDLENFKGQSLSIQTEKQNLEASSDLLLSRSLFWTPSLSASAVKRKAEATSQGQTSATESDYLQADMKLNLFRGGGDWDAMQAASAAKKAAVLRLVNEALAVEIKASDLIFKSIYLIESRRIQEGLLKLKEESLRIVTNRYDQGKLPGQEVTKAEVDLAQQKNKVRLSQLEVSENKSQIRSAFVTVVATTDWPFSEATKMKTESRSQLPLIEQKYWLSQAKEEAWQASKAGHWPSLDLDLVYQDSPIQERTTHQWVGLVTLTLPLWSKYETTAQVSSAYADRLASLNDYRDTEQSLQQRSQFLKEKVDLARQNLIESKKNLDKAKRLYQDILKSFRLGRISTNDLFIEQNRLLDSENDLALSQLSFHQSLMESCALAGTEASGCLR
jgi:outer membrane protein TolC